MFLYAEGEILTSVEAEPFQDSEGQTVKYSVNTLRLPDGILTLNSKDSFGELGKHGVAKIKVRQLYNENGSIKGSKLTLAGFVVGESIDTQE